jgi:hypothetical protein
MKTVQKNLTRSALVLLFIAIGASRTLAYDHDNNGWFDNQHQYHSDKMIATKVIVKKATTTMTTSPFPCYYYDGSFYHFDTPPSSGGS